MIEAVEVPEYVEVSFTGEATIEHSIRMGTYELQEESLNNFPVWKKDGEEEYLFVLLYYGYEFWVIGSDLESDDVHFYHLVVNPTPLTPVSLADDWYYDSNGLTVDGGWELDDTFMIEAVEVPEYVEVSFTGEATIEHSIRMGTYELQEESLNNFPVWKKDGEEEYLFVLLYYGYEFWVIGSDLESDDVHFYHLVVNPTPLTPVSLADDWYYDSNGLTVDGGWELDDTFMIEAVEVPEYVEVSFTGEATIEHSIRMGTYELQEESLNNFPVWKKDGEEEYLFVLLY
jgi:hypothetical protein